MRICYVADGRNVHTHRWMRYFTGRQHSVHLISFAPLTADEIQNVRATGAVYHGYHDNLHVKRFWRTLKTLVWLRRVLRREQIDLLHCHFLGANAWYGALSGFHPLIITVMGGDITGDNWSPAEDVRERFLTPFALRRADLVTCWSYNLTKVVKRYRGSQLPIAVIHGGVDLERFMPGEKPRHLIERWSLPPDARVVLSPRLMRPLYNIDQIALAAGKVCADDPRAYFLFAYAPVATNVTYESRVRAIIREHGLTERVRFVGEVPHEEMADYYRLADVVVSVPDTDGTPLSVLEAMACGIPVLVSRISDYDQKYIEPDVTVLDAPAHDADMLAQALLRLLQDRPLASSLTANARQRVEQTAGYHEQMSRMEYLYEQLATKSRTNAALIVP